MLTNSLNRFINEETFLYRFQNAAQYLQTDLLRFIPLASVCDCLIYRNIASVYATLC
jgi:hypothetical protein